MPTQLEKDAKDGTHFLFKFPSKLLTISHWWCTKWAKPQSSKIIVLTVGEHKDVHNRFNVPKQYNSSRSEIIL